MRRRFTIQPGEVFRFQQTGFLIKHRFLPQALTNGITSVSKQLVQRMTEQGENHNSVICREDLPYIINDLPWLTPQYTALLASLNLWQAIASLIGTDRLVYHYSSLLVKQPNMRSVVNWHRDFANQFIAPVFSDYLRVFVPLSPFQPDNGALQVIPGSHKLPDRAVFLSAKGIPKAFPAPEALECQPGDVVFMHPKTLHSSCANCSDTPRINLVMQLAKSQRPLHAYSNSEKYFGENRLQLIHHASQTNINSLHY